MKTYRLTLQFTSPLMTPLTADTLFGHLCWAAVRQSGEAGLKELLRPFREGQSPFVLSDGFPENYLPRPFGVEMLVTNPDEKKKIRSVQWVNREEFNEIRTGRLPESLFTERRKEGGIRSGIATRNAVNRVSNTTLPEGGVYNLEEFYPETIEIYLQAKDESAKNRFMELLEDVAKTGFGKKKSIGKGQFTVHGIEKYDFKDVDNANGFVSLSNFCPGTDDPTDGLYKIFVKYGKTSEEMLPDSPFKRPLLMLKCGSVFKTDGPPRPYYGRMVAGVAPKNADVVQYAYAFAVPIRYTDSI